MPSTSSPNKGYELMADVENIGTWGSKTNANLSIADLNLGGRATITLSNITPINLNNSAVAPSARNVIFLLGGSLSANIDIVYPAIGGIFVVSNGTIGAFTVNIRSAGGGTGTKIRQGATRMLYCDGVNVTAADSQGDVPATTTMLFAQAAAPAGWTKIVDAAKHDIGMRVVTTTAGGLTGGTHPFLGDGGNTSATGGVFAVDGTLATVLALTQIPSHNHVTSGGGSFRTNHAGSSNISAVATGAGAGNNGLDAATQVSGGGLGHNHPLNLTLKYIDIILATKDAA